MQIQPRLEGEPLYGAESPWNQKRKTKEDRPFGADPTKVRGGTAMRRRFTLEQKTKTKGDRPFGADPTKVRGETAIRRRITLEQKRKPRGIDRSVQIQPRLEGKPLYVAESHRNKRKPRGIDHLVQIQPRLEGEPPKAQVHPGTKRKKPRKIDRSAQI